MNAPSRFRLWRNDSEYEARHTETQQPHIQIPFTWWILHWWSKGILQISADTPTCSLVNRTYGIHVGRCRIHGVWAVIQGPAQASGPHTDEAFCWASRYWRTGMEVRKNGVGKDWDSMIIYPRNFPNLFNVIWWDKVSSYLEVPYAERYPEAP